MQARAAKPHNPHEVSGLIMVYTPRKYISLGAGFFN